MKFQVFHVNPGEKLMKKADNNELIRSLINFPIDHRPKRFCEMYYILGLQIYKSPYCHHVEPLEVALKTVGIFKLPS